MDRTVLCIILGIIIGFLFVIVLEVRDIVTILKDKKWPIVMEMKDPTMMIGKFI